MSGKAMSIERIKHIRDDGQKATKIQLKQIFEAFLPMCSNCADTDIHNSNSYPFGSLLECNFRCIVSRLLERQKVQAGEG